jgi:hypothetical protein
MALVVQAARAQEESPLPPPTAAVPYPAEPQPTPSYAPPPPAADARVVYGPSYAYDYRPERRYQRPRRSRGMMISGFVLFGVSYLVPAITGAYIGSLKDVSCECGDASRMLIPVAGPLTLLHHEERYIAFDALLITDAVLQTAGLVLSVFGIISYVRSGADDDEDATAPLPRPRLSVNVAPSRGGALATLRLQL